MLRNVFENGFWEINWLAPWNEVRICTPAHMESDMERAVHDFEHVFKSENYAVDKNGFGKFRVYFLEHTDSLPLDSKYLATVNDLEIYDIYYKPYFTPKLADRVKLRIVRGDRFDVYTVPDGIALRFPAHSEIKPCIEDANGFRKFDYDYKVEL